MSKSSGIHYLSDHKAAADARPVPPEIGRIRDTVTAGLGDLLQGALDAVDDSLFELANNARSNNEQNRYFEAMREIRIKRKGVERQFRKAITDLFSHPPRVQQSSERNSQQTASADTLSLVGHDDLEEQVALNAMVTKANAHFQGSLIPLQARFSQMYAGTPDGEPVNPMAPEYLCEAFAQASEALDIHIRERLIVLKQFDRYVVSNLGMLLDEANRILVQAGVIPNFRYHGKSSPKREAPDAQTDTQRPSIDEPPTSRTAGSSGRENTALFDQIRRLMAQQRTTSGHVSREADPSVHVVDGKELMELLRALPMQQTMPESGDLSDGEPVILDLQQLVYSTLARQTQQSGQEPALKEVDEDLINLVSMLFEFILDDDNLSAPVQVLISRLQIPILKVVIKDKTFFSKASHPARKLLNSLARAGIGWNNSDEKAKDRLYNQIHTVVQRILEDFDGDIALFEDLNREFEQFLERENRKASLVEQRTRESERGRIKSRQAQEEVDHLLKEKTRNYELPESIHDILINGWSRVMFLAYLRDDSEHRWQESVKVVDDLLWCLNPHHDDKERDEWVRVVPGLLKTLRAGLREVSYKSNRLDEVMAALKNQLADAFRNHTAISTPKPDTADAQTKENDSSDEPASVHDDAALGEYIEQIDTLKIGDWVEFRLVNGASFRCKLSAVIEEANSFVFVNRMGLKVIEKNRLDLASELRKGRLSLLDQGALIDRALNAVVGNLRTKTA
jgi:hypothetical protein